MKLKPIFYLPLGFFALPAIVFIIYFFTEYYQNQNDKAILASHTSTVGTVVRGYDEYKGSSRTGRQYFVLLYIINDKEYQRKVEPPAGVGINPSMQYTIWYDSLHPSQSLVDLTLPVIPEKMKVRKAVGTIMTVAENHIVFRYTFDDGNSVFVPQATAPHPPIKEGDEYPVTYSTSEPLVAVIQLH